MSTRLGTRIIAGVTIAAAASFAAAGVAAAGPGNCDAGEVCLYENYDYNQGNTNHVHQWVGNDSDYNGNNWYNATTSRWSSDGLNDETSSIRNRGNACNVRLYQNSNGGGAGSTFARGANDGYLANNTIGDNRATSHFWCV